MKTNRKYLAAAAFAAAASLAGCFGGDDDPVAPPASTVVPDSAAASGAAFFAYMLTLGSADESSEPLGIGDGFAVPPDEASEPAALS